MSLPKETPDTEQQSYFYVVWPEDGKSPGGTTTCISSAEVITSSCSSSATTRTGTASTLALATTMPTLTSSRPPLSYEVADSRRNSSSSSIQSRSPEQSPMHMQAVYNMASLPSRTILHGSLDESAKISSNGGAPGIRPAHHVAALSPSSAAGLAGTATTSTTYVIPSTARASGRHKNLTYPTDLAPLQRHQYKGESDTDTNMSDISEFNNILSQVACLFVCLFVCFGYSVEV